MQPLFISESLVNLGRSSRRIGGFTGRVLLLIAVSCLDLTGCNSFQKKHDNPVMVEAPKRVDKIERDESDTQLADSREIGTKKMRENDRPDITQVGATKKDPWDGWEDDTAIFNSQVAATVNGAPILNGDVLDRYSGYLISVREAMQKYAKNPKTLQPGQSIPTPQDFEKFRYMLIQKDIAQHIQKKLLVERLKGSLKPEQMKQMNAHVDQMFEKEIDRLKVEHKVANRTELELELNKKGTTLQNVKDNFALDRLSTEYVMAKSDKPDPIERPDLIAYYQANPELFRFPTKVKWQQLQVSVTPELNKKDARKKLERAIAELDSGVPFEKVAKNYSDGPTAKDGGAWDWMEAGNLADTKLEAKLFEMPLNELSAIHEGTDSFCVVKVTDRKPAGRKPFKEVQDEIRSTLTKEQWEHRPVKLLRDLYTRAVIETPYDFAFPKFPGEE